MADQTGRVRVLHVTDRWENGGVERFIASILEHADGKAVESHVLSICRPSVTVEGLTLEPPLVHRATRLGKVAGALRLRRFLAARRYDVLHIHTSNALGLYYAHIARRLRVPTRIVHSHNSRMSDSALMVKAPLNRVGKWLFGEAPTHRWACSSEAGMHLFDSRGFEVIKNGIDVKRFTFNPAARDTARMSLGIPADAMLVGSIGRLSPQKNPLFLLDIFRELRDRDAETRFVIVGDGELRDEVEQKVERFGLSDVCRIVGYSDRPEEYLSAMDVLVCPSLFEGLPIALVEAQASGVTVVASDAISLETRLTDSYHLLPLSAGAAQWAEHIVAVSETALSRSDAHLAVSKAGFSIETVTEQIAACYVTSILSVAE